LIKGKPTPNGSKGDEGKTIAKDFGRRRCTTEGREAGVSDGKGILYTEKK